MSVNGAYSSWIDVLNSIPQGSVLGPILFLLFVDEIPELVRSPVKLFADDTKIWQTALGTELTQSRCKRTWAD